MAALTLFHNLQGKNSNACTTKFLAGDAAQHQKNLQDVYGANTAVAQQNQLNWDLNTFTPYQQKYNRALQQSNAGVQNLTGGLSNLGTGLVADATSFGKLKNRLGNNYGINPNAGSSTSGNGAPDDGEIT